MLIDDWLVLNDFTYCTQHVSMLRTCTQSRFGMDGMRADATARDDGSHNDEALTHALTLSMDPTALTVVQVKKHLE